MNKKAWVKPEVNFVQFAAGEYCITPCSNDGAINYIFNCNALYEGSYYSWIAFDNNSETENGSAKFHYHPEHSWDAYNYMKNDPNNSYTTTDQIHFTSTFQSEYDQLLYDNTFHACDKEVTASSRDSFFGGWLIPKIEGDMSIDNAKAITIWTGPDNNNIHATYVLGVENLDVAHS